MASVKCRDCRVLDEKDRCSDRALHRMNPDKPRFCTVFTPKGRRPVFEEGDGRE